MARQRRGERYAVIAGEEIVVRFLGNLAARFFLWLIKFEEWNRPFIRLIIREVGDT